MDYAKESLRLHGEWKGKIEVVTRVCFYFCCFSVAVFPVWH